MLTFKRDNYDSTVTLYITIVPLYLTMFSFIPDRLFASHHPTAELLYKCLFLDDGGSHPSLSNGSCGVWNRKKFYHTVHVHRMGYV